MTIDSIFINKIKQTFAETDAELVLKAYTFSAERMYAWDTTPFKAADLLIDHGADAITIAASLLAPLLWRDLAGLEQIRKDFGQIVSTTLENLNLYIPLNVGERQYQNSNIHDFLTAIGRAPRNAFLMIVFRLLALENGIDPHEADISQIAQETIDFYVPIADRLSLGEIRRRLEDRCFRILDPINYDRLKRSVAPIQSEDNRCLHVLLSGVERLLKKNGIHCHIQGRIKSLYGIWNKMIRTDKPLEEIMDRIGLRIIVDAVPECYAVLGLLHTHFKPIPGTFDDYIGLPKNNGYQSIHTCVYPVREVSHKPIEFQVRTELMHMEAEHGSAAHWRYKSKKESDEHDKNQAKWMENLMLQHEKLGSTKAFIELLHQQVVQDHLVVFGNGGRIVRLAENATVEDFLNVSNHRLPKNAVVKVNGKMAMRDRPLRDGDSIDVVAAEDKDVHISRELLDRDFPRSSTRYPFCQISENMELFGKDLYGGR